jgi:hypothetical protein
MTESATITDSGQATQSTPTNHLRFNKTIVAGKPRFVLQQLHTVKIYRGSDLVEQRVEWRNVETVEDGV